MGMYDTLNFICPACNQVTSEQSKVGECRLAEYNLTNAPLLVIADINDEGERGRLYCGECNKALQLEVRFIVTPRVKGSDPDDDELRIV